MAGIVNKVSCNDDEDDYVMTGTLSNFDDDGSENITKNEFASFQTLSRLLGTALFVKCRRRFQGVEFLRALSMLK